jgi:hypothetical protein
MSSRVSSIGSPARWAARYLNTASRSGYSADGSTTSRNCTESASQAWFALTCGSCRFIIGVGSRTSPARYSASSSYIAANFALCVLRVASTTNISIWPDKSQSSSRPSTTTSPGVGGM